MDICVRKWDKVYCELLKQILKEGEEVNNRTGINTISIEGVNFKLDVLEEFPILETKKVVMKNALSEMLWIHQAQSNDVSWLNERGNNIWDEWKIDADGIYRTYEPSCEYDPTKEVVLYDINNNPIMNDSKPYMVKSLIEGKTIKSAKYFGKEYAGTIGTAYGWINNKFKKPQSVLHTLKTNPRDRRMNISLWQDEYIKTAVLPSCVWSIEFKVYKDRLHGYVHQRSADVPLGLPFNVSQYAILLAMFAKVSNLEVGNLNWSIMDAHIYVNQLDGIKTQILRYEKMLQMENNDIYIKYYQLFNRLQYLKKYAITENDSKLMKEIEQELELYTLMITKEKAILSLANKDDFFEFSNEFNNDKEYLKQNITGNEDIKILKYSYAPFIKMPIAQ